MHIYFGESGIIILAAILAVGIVSGAVAGWVAVLSLRALRRSVREMEGIREDVDRKLAEQRSGLVLRCQELEGRIASLEMMQDVDGAGPIELEDLERPLPEPAESEPAAEKLPPQVVAEAGPPEEAAPLEAQAMPGPPTPDRAGHITEPPPPPTPPNWSTWFEENVGKRWMTWAGALALFLSAAFFLKHAFENQWLGPTGRVVLGIVSGLVLLIAGDFCLRRRMRALGQGLVGGGLAILYVSLFAAFSFYRLIPQGPAFAAMIIVTAGGMALAILHGALPLAILAVLGGFLSPVMVSTGEVVRDPLFAYLTVLDLGVLGTAFFKRWRLLDILAFAGTWFFFGVWFVDSRPLSQVLPALLWISCFYFVFLLIPFVYQLRTGAETQVERFLLALANAVVAFCFAYLLLRHDYQFVLGFVALGMSACYIVLAVLCRSRMPQDTRALFGFVSLSVVLLTLAVPLHLKLHGITMAWAMEAPILVYLGYRFRYRPVRIAGALVLGLAVWRLFVAHWPLHYGLYTPLVNRAFLSAMTVPIGAAAYAVVHRRFSSDQTTVDRYLKIASTILAGFLTILVVNVELHGWLLRVATELEMPTGYLAYSVSPIIWAVGAAGFLAGSVWTRSRASFYAGLAALACAAALSMTSYGVSLGRSYALFFNARFFAGIIVAAVIFAFVFISSKYGDFLTELDRYAVKAAILAAAVFPLVLLSVEVAAYCQATVRGYARKRWLTHMSLSIVWGLYSVAALVVGFWRDIRQVRIGALVLLAVTGIKLVLIDMAMVEQIYRVISFVALGLIMILASFLYHRLEKRLQQSSGEGQ